MVSALGGEIRPSNSATEITPAVTRAEVERDLWRHRRETGVHGHVDRNSLRAGVHGRVVTTFADLPSQSERHDAKADWITVRHNHRAGYCRILLELGKVQTQIRDIPADWQVLGQRILGRCRSWQ